MSRYKFSPNIFKLNSKYYLDSFLVRIDRAHNPSCGLDNNVNLQRGIIKGNELYARSVTCKEFWLN